MPKKFTLSELADKDLEDIFDYSFAEFGFKQAVNYLEEIDLVCSSLSNQSLMGISRGSLGNEMRSFVYRYHTIFYKIISEDLIFIERILHGSRDIPNYFKE